MNKTFLLFKAFLLLLLSTTTLFSQQSVKSPHGDNLNFACETCHTEADWHNVPSWKFNHDQTGYPLVGDHSTLKCFACHTDLHFNRVGIACMDCHTDIHKGEFGNRCEDCHNAVNWENRQEIFDQHFQTDFPLIGVHANLDCESCHINEQGRQFVNLSVECQSCHLTDYMNTLSPSHQKAQFDLNCQNCHLANVSTWDRAVFEHSQTFPLTGGHAGIECADCHTNGFGGTATDCYSCHRTEYEQSSEPNHLLFGFPTVCENCHDGISWERSSFDHFAESGFALEGAHKTALCVDCHVNNQLSGLERECFGCHVQDFNTTEDPDHVANNFDHNCESCHNQNAWEPADFDHNQTDFPLTGAHRTTLCADCHTDGYTNTPADCWSCHENDFNTTEDPNHVVNNFDHACETCHSTNAWEPAEFDHNQTEFPLTGAHITANCADCHTQGYQVALALDCYSCHESDFNSTQEPNHQVNNFDHNCETCHSTSAWEPANFDHAATDFPLTGAHMTTNCADCHVSGYTVQLPTDCWSCHDNDFNLTQDPNHVNNNFDHDCTQCHNTSAWEPANFDHSATEFPLTGAHMTTNCADCHTQGYQVQLATDCYSCHDNDFNSAQDPNHVNNNFDHNCETCHSTSAWEPANFDHSATEFPLTGAHMTTNCVDCHTQGYQVQLATDCYSCHDNDFNSAQDPNHVSNNFDHDCMQCHSTSAWEPANFDHSATEFPLTGAHQTVNCATCHTQGYQVQLSIDCYSCHENDFNSAQDPNHVTNNFDHNCETCHSTSAWEPANFDHSATEFPLTGAHQTVNCASCHTQGYQVQLPND
ncbi:MAG: hypothetical protein KDF60_08120, partial [Calditrichaeota bacterium]|nr:hypothetical protein [Calditrichota bacterium]